MEATAKLGGKEMLHWRKSTKQTGEWLPAETLRLPKIILFLKGPLTTPIGGGIH